MNIKRNIFILVSFLFFTNAIYCQNQKLKFAEADSLFKNKEYQKAENIYINVIKVEPENRAAIYKLASLYYSEKKYDDAIKNYLILAPNKNPNVLYNLACAYSLNNNRTEALKYLKEAVDNGFTQADLLKTDSDLEIIRSEREFEDILKSIKTLENFPEAQKFDFWVGNWNVYNPLSQKAGESKIEKILKGSVIMENWTGINGYTGKSFNHFDMNKKQWIQNWVDQNSDAINFEGNYDSTKNAIVYFSYDHAKDEQPYIRRLTFFNIAPDTVRQFSQRSFDEGKTWATEYDFIYVRKKGSASSQLEK